MYSETAIQSLEKRIRWNEALDSDSPVTLSEGNKEGTSGRHFQSFHQLVTIENLYAAVPKITMNVEKFNVFLSDLRKQAVLSVLGNVLDDHAKYDELKDYDAEIEAKVRVFDDAIGFKLAQSVLEYFMSTERKNFQERNAKLAIGNLKLEINGFRNDANVLVAPGIIHELNTAIKSARKKFFPIVPIIQDGSDKW